MKHFSFAVAAALAVAALPASAQVGSAPLDAASQKAGEEKAVNLCSTCHGPRGISTSPEFPILAAQRRGYLEAQLEAFRSHTRSEKIAHDFMWGIAGGLDDKMIGAVAGFYAAQPPAPGRPSDPALVAKGKQLFDQGVADRGIPACASCHGPDATGLADFPRLAGQHAKYVVKQLEYIQSLVRSAPVMHGIIKDITPDEMRAVAAYV
ncbi:MAG TPA: c-type cytochrome, partial [Usitatibacter sp.]|nr:c-type cytochrome [Usitatibacter sp.]